jgi:hypothetical protein
MSRESVSNRPICHLFSSYLSPVFVDAQLMTNFLQLHGTSSECVWLTGLA